MCIIQISISCTQSILDIGIKIWMDISLLDPWDHTWLTGKPSQLTGKPSQYKFFENDRLIVPFSWFNMECIIKVSKYDYG